MDTLMIIDGNSIVNRAFYGIRPLTTKEGLHTNAVYGFLNILFKYTAEVSPAYIVVAFDVSRKTFRNEMFTEYKAQRSGMPDELAEQMPVLKEVLSALNIDYIEKENYEADDLIGTVSKMCEDKGIKCNILTGDRDDLQLASPTTTVMLVTTKQGQTTTENYDDKKVFEKYGLTPDEFIDLKGLMGDKSDNIPGVRGVGEVTALNLLTKYRTIPNVYEHIDEIKGATQKKLIEDKDSAFLSKELATIIRDVPLEHEIDDFKVKEPHKNELIQLFEKLEFKNFIKKFELTEEQTEKETVTIKKFTELKHTDEICYLIDKDTFYILQDGEIHSAPLLECIEKLKPAFESKEIRKFSYGIKEDIISLAKLGVDYCGYAFDIKIAAYVLDPSESDYKLTKIAFSHTGKDFENDYEAVSVFPELIDTMNNRMSETDVDRLYYDIELPIIEILAKMQLEGVKIDAKELENLTVKFGNELSRLETEIYSLSGEEFNINSPKQLGVILFEKLGLKSKKKTKTGYSTDQAVLESLANDHPVINKIIEYRQIAKLKSTYVDSMLSLCDENNILHSKFHQTVTQTGRLSSSEPNLQNIPVRLQLGRELRKTFVPKKDGYIFVSADYSQIELRVLAQICGDPNLIEAFMNDEDIHTQAASRIFNMPVEMVTPKMRSDAKTVNFGILYGKTEFTLAKDLGVSRKEAKDIIDTYLGKYPHIRTYMSNITEYAKDHGFVRTLLGRIRYIKELSDRNHNIRMFGERIALNTPIQGTAADIIKIAMINVYNKLKEEIPDAKLVLQIHDELVIEAKSEDGERVINLLKEQMQSALKINVPLKVSVAKGENMYELK